jgi:sulfur transfer protein SufE
VVPQPPYSPDPCDFFLFPKLKFHFKGRHFGTVDNIQKVMTDQVRALLHEDFQHCYREWEQRLRRCLASQVNYFEGDNELDIYRGFLYILLTVHLDITSGG